MSVQSPIPKALFDTMGYLNLEPCRCVLDYINATQLPLAHQEFNLTREFLLSYAGSSDTFTSYRREVERLLHWTWLLEKKSLKDIKRNDIRNYLEFVNHPPKSWITDKNIARFINSADGLRVHNPDWRPFVVKIPKSLRADGHLPDITQYRLTSKSLQAMLASLSTYFTFLQQEDYLDHNPITLVRQKNRYLQKTQSQKVTRKLTPLQWNHVIDVAQSMAEIDPEHNRTYFMMSAFYLLGLRISELAQTPGRYPKMSDFAPDKRGLWWFTTVGKGNKMRDVAVPDSLLEILKQYRLSRGLTPLPPRGEEIPLLHRLRGPGGLGTRQVRNLVQQCFDRAVDKLRLDGKTDEAEDLRTATVHWLRHTAISSDVEFRPREHVRDDVGHEDPATTERYIDADRLERHQSAKNKPLKTEL